jgi:hypothetical protein
MSVHPWTDLPALLARLDAALEVAVGNARVRYGIGPGADPYRGLYVGDDEVNQLVRQSVSEPGLGAGAPMDWPTLRRSWGGEPLDDFGTAALVLALAPEIDLKYERIFGYLQDDVSARRPRVALALDLFCPDLPSRLAARDRFSADAPLRQRQMVVLDGGPELPLLGRTIRLDPQLIRYLLGGSGLDDRLAPWCEVVRPGQLIEPMPLDAIDHARLDTWLEQLHAGRPLRLVLHGPDEPLLARLAVQLADQAGIPLLRVEQLPADGALGVLGTEARLLNYGILVRGRGAPTSAMELGRLREAEQFVLVTSDRPIPGAEQQGFELAGFDRPTPSVRRQWWRRSTDASDSDVDRLAARFRLTATEIETAAAAAQRDCDHRGQLGFTHYAQAARRQTAHALDSLATRVDAQVGWDDLVLPADAICALHELCDRVTHRHTVLRSWGMDRRTHGRLGVNALFAGSSGTGKTMAAQVIAGELGLDLFAIDLSGVVSKYIGETEKNLDAIFAAAENTDAVLLFDEADALFGKRSQVRDSHDRYANLEVSYLLQRMEAHDGVAVLASNLRQNLDEAFLRRLAFIIRFPFPEVAQRRAIWAAIWPPAVPRATDVDVDELAAQFRLSGGAIRNAAVGAAFLAAARDRPMTMADVLEAIDREYDKLGGAAAPVHVPDRVGMS